MNIRTSFHLVLSGILVLLLFSCSTQPSAEEIIKASIDFHDPQRHWAAYRGTLVFEESRPDMPARATQVWLDNAASYFRINRNNTEVHGMLADSCFVEKGEADCGRAETMRNYYTYLWGLPMKLQDPGVKPNREVNSGMLGDIQVHIVTVPYENDTWQFYFSRDTYELLAYSFVKKDGSGEYILPDGVYSAGGMRLLNNRSWYTLDSTFLGTDRLMSDNTF